MKLSPEGLIGGGVSAEFADVDLGHARRDARLGLVVDRLAVGPERSFPKLVQSVAEREGLYRLFENEDVHWEDILAPHFAATAQRAFHSGRVRVAHDTSDLVYSGIRKGLGPVVGKTNGLFMHTSLVVGDGEERAPLGIIEMLPYVRPPTKTAKMRTLNERKLEVRKRSRSLKESCRWELCAEAASQRLGHREVIHLMDQEADDYTLFVELMKRHLRFVVRGTSNRLLATKGSSVQSELDRTQVEFCRTVPVSKRKAHRGEKDRKSHPPRAEREAHLSLRWAELTIEKPQHARAELAEIRLWVVQVFEADPPEGEQPICWTLYTSEPVTDAASALVVVDDYRARWRIEEYFRALKQGCAIQKRQLETVHALLNALAVFIPIAWHLLALRTVARDSPEQPATALFAPEQLNVLAALLKHHGCKPLTGGPTVRDAMLAVAALGGHIRNNGEPGWLTLAEGHATLMRAIPVWEAARSVARSDQS